MKKGLIKRQWRLDRAVKNVMKKDAEAKKWLLHFEKINGIGIHSITFKKVKAEFNRVVRYEEV